MLYFLLILAVFLVPISIRVWVNTEKDAIIIQAGIMLPFKSGIKFFKKSITAKNIITSLFSRKKAKRNKAPIFNMFLKYVKIKKINIFLKIGTGDASSTALISGQIFGLAAPYMANISKGNFNIDITPVFDETAFDFSGECIFSLNFVKIIIIFLKTKISGGKKKWKSIQLKT